MKICTNCGGEVCAEDLIYEASVKLKRTGGVQHCTRWMRSVRRCVCVYLRACVCVYMCVCDPKHPWPLTGLVCLNVGKADKRPTAAEDTDSMSRGLQSLNNFRIFTFH